MTRTSKRSTAAGALAGLMLLGLVPAAQAAPGDNVAVPDDALLACINVELSQSPTDPVNEGQMASVINLYCGQDSIIDLTGLEMATSLQMIDLNQNAVTDVSALQNLTTLNQLFLAQNSISDVTPVLGLPSLTTLDLSGNTDLNANLAAIGAMTSLTRLSLASSSLNDVTPLAGLTSLKHLELRYNSISDLSPLGSLTSLEYLNVNSNSVSDVTALASLTSLTDLSLNGNSISDVSPLVTMPIALTATGQDVDLGQLIVGDPVSNPVTNVAGSPVALDAFYDAGTNTLTPTASGPGQAGWAEGVFSGTLSFNAAAGIVMPDNPLRACVNAVLGQNPADGITAAQAASVGGLNCAFDGVTDLTGLEEFVNLDYLDLFGNSVADLGPLAGLTELDFLDLGDNNITDVNALAGLTLLETLYLEGNNITDVNALAGLTLLETLYLEDNNITDVNALAALTLLTDLDLEDNNITDVAPLAGLTLLEYLDLEGNNISDVSPLAGLTLLKGLYLDHNAIADVGVLGGLSAWVVALDQVIDLGQLVIEGAEANPVVGFDGAPVALDALYDSGTNTFTPTALGVGSVGWMGLNGSFSGTLIFEVVTELETTDPDPGTEPGAGDGGSAGDDADADADAGAGAGAGATGQELSNTGLDAVGLATVAMGLLLAGGLMIARTRFKLRK